MKIDLYTKIALTIIAGCLLVIAIRQLSLAWASLH
jgi:hypothetical protein